MDKVLVLRVKIRITVTVRDTYRYDLFVPGVSYTKVIWYTKCLEVEAQGMAYIT